MQGANDRIQKQYLEIKKSRQRKLDLDNWVSSYSAADESYSQHKINRPTTDPSCVIVHENANSFRSDKPIVNHITAIDRESKIEEAKLS